MAEEATAMSASQSGSGTPKVRGQAYVFARWEQLTDVNAPWWTRMPGLGIRLRLLEIQELVYALQGGEIARQAVQRLLADSQAVLRGKYLRTSFPEIDRELREVQQALRGDPLEAFVPGGALPEAVAAGLQHLEDNGHSERLIDDLATAADAASAPGQMRELDELLQFLDADLVADGHSLNWRRQVRNQAAKLCDDGATLGGAIKQALTESGRAHRAAAREFDVIIPVAGLVEPASGTSGIVVISHDEAVEIVRSWPGTNAAALLAADHLSEHNVRYQRASAHDIFGAAHEADGLFRRDAALWRLRGGRVEEPRAALISDGTRRQAGLYDLPAEPLDVVPDGLDEYIATHLTGQPTAIDNALGQIAEVRMAAPASAVVDLWIAAEALFGGASGDPNYEAGLVMAGLAEFIVVRDTFAWLAGRFEGAGLGTPPAGDAAVSWAYDQLFGPGKGAFSNTVKHLDAANDELGWLRVKQIAGWDEGWGFKTETISLHKRMARICDRAYLIRNFVVHRADPLNRREVRSHVLGVTLPAFAGLVQASVGHVLRYSPGGDALQHAKLITMRARRAAEQLEGSGPGPLAPLLNPPRR